MIYSNKSSANNINTYKDDSLNKSEDSSLYYIFLKEFQNGHLDSDKKVENSIRYQNYFVKKGKVLIRRIDESDVEAINGIITETRLIKTKKPAMLKCLGCCEYNNDTIIATSDGYVSLKENSISVTPELIINSDISVHDGELLFCGKVIINGDVCSKAKIKAYGDITVNGNVVDSSLITTHSIYVTQNAISSTLKAGFSEDNKQINNEVKTDVSAFYLQNCDVYAKNNVYILGKGCYNTNIIAGNGVEFKNSHAVCRNGKVFAENYIIASEVGSTSGVITHLASKGKGVITAETAQPNTIISIDKQLIRIDNLVSKLKVYQKNGEIIYEKFNSKG